MRNAHRFDGDSVYVTATNSDAEACIDASDFDAVSKRNWHLDATGYFCSSLWKSRVRLHDYIVPHTNGQVCDHWDANKLNNRRSNLRIVSRSENNYAVKKRNNGMPYVGVFFSRSKTTIRFFTKPNRMVGKTFSSHSAEEVAICRDIEIIRKQGLSSKTNLLPPMPEGCLITVA